MTGFTEPDDYTWKKERASGITTSMRIEEHQKKEKEKKKPTLPLTLTT
jgi:hypothetical protein